MAIAKGGILEQVRRNLAGLFGGESNIPVSARRGPRTAESRSADADFESRLKSLLERPDASGLLSGRINFIGLGKAKERLGAAWERMAERAERIARHTINLTEQAAALADAADLEFAPEAPQAALAAA